MIILDARKFIERNSLIPGSKLVALKNLSDSVKHLNGDIAEVGVFNGGSAYLLAASNPDKIVYCCDTFEGLPETSKFDNYCKKGDFKSNFDYVRGLLSGFDNVAFFRGVFPSINPGELSGKKFRLVHLDVDIYTSVLECSEYFYPKMVEGGIIIYDDYGNQYCEGATIALDLFLKDKPEKLILSSHAYFIKK